MNKILSASLISLSLTASINVMANEIGTDSIDFNDRELLAQQGREYLYDNDSTNDTTAINYLNRAIELGCWQSAEIMGGYHYHKSGTNAPRDINSTLYFYKKAYELGSPSAKVNVEAFTPLLPLCDSIAIYEKQAEQGDVNAMNRLAIAYFNGAGVIENEEKAIEYLKQAAEKGDLYAKRDLGMYYYLGIIVDQNIALGVSLIEEAANAGDPTSQFFMSCFYAEAMPFTKDNAKALEWYEKALAQNQRNALYNTATQYYDGTLRKQDYAMAAEYFERAASLGHANANSMLAFCYIEGTGVEKDVAKAIEYYKKSAELGNRNAFAYLGNLHLFTRHGVCDIAEARKWYEIASFYNVDVDAQLEYCRIASEFNQIKQQAEQGDENSICDMIKCYRLGIFVEQDENEAIKWAKKLESDYDKNVIIGNIYFGKKNPDYHKALKHYKLAGDEESIYDTEIAIEYSENVNRYKKDAANGNAEAMYNLAYCYANGYGVEYSNYLANEYYLRAADAGYADAMYEVAQMWRSSEGEGAKYNYWMDKYLEAIAEE